MAASSGENFGKLVLRFTVGGIILFHGIYKLQHGIGWMEGPLSNWHLPLWLGYAVYLAEVVAPLMLFLGWMTRLAALFIMADMLFAICMVVHDNIFKVKGSGAWGIETEAFLLLSSLALVFLGGGRFAIASGKSRWQ